MNFTSMLAAAATFRYPKLHRFVYGQFTVLRLSLSHIETACRLKLALTLPSTLTGHPMALPPAEVIKRQANKAFKAGDYQVATSLYSRAMSLNADNPLYVLNRAMSNLKLESWRDAEDDATLALKLSASDAVAQKALFRRSRARKAQGDLTGARTDLDTFVARGGKKEVADAENLVDPLARAPCTVNQDDTPGDPAVETSPTTLPAMPSTDAYEIKDTVSMGKGAFATRILHRGDLILSEKPVIRLPPEYSTIAEGSRAILAAVSRLTAEDLRRFLSLQNSYKGDVFVGIFRTNAFPDGLGFDTSRFNHSCLPNARYSWHEESGRLRIFALKEIPVGEEICVAYLASRNLYGSTRDERHKMFIAKFNFTRSCRACSLKGPALKASDDRRREAAVLYKRMMTHEPRFQGERVLRDAVRAIHLLQEEGYAADVDDFATDAGGLCALHSDWESAKYWAKLGYDSRCAEFGEDHEHSRRVKRYCDNPRTYPQAGMYSGQKFPLRV
ncbi:hypothetical protein C8R43DRAFT_967626 [Mycena crocata]|nr:hypothetical protein C8R43DRAFT_967626 [Mycena crocata]